MDFNRTIRFNSSSQPGSLGEVEDFLHSYGFRMIYQTAHDNSQHSGDVIIFERESPTAGGGMVEHIQTAIFDANGR